ncbi:inverse autotransporter beta domain-containing protein, partial [bacterium endosymbiont of Bathymodiolus sp. 5 South]|uniref:inverse autotransporter beta domain-containing protein n=2 Tax=bacterium endosymbiont of Bathymodiolus sp. 5 South TaxID=1181670 RepID=UPI001117BFC0
SSAFKQFKCFLALSLLITFSFNAFSVDDPQQFNKEAYLDLSKPYTYNWNNAQPTTKQDNQATTLLKKVAGTARAALGSTNSDNANQLGNKLTTGIRNKLKNQAINKTEGLVNDKANKFLNAFGAGRSEVSINGMNTDRLNYSIKTIQPISELNTNSKALTFFQGGIASNKRHKSSDNRRTTINLGVGHRLLVEDDMAIVGINVFTDYETKSRHRRLSLGLEYQRTNFSANINKYHMLSGKKLVNDTGEKAFSGYDVKFSGQAPYLPWAKIKGTYYHWDTISGPDIKGNILGVDIELTPSVNFEFGQENNNTINATNYGKFTVKLPLGNKQKSINYAIASKAFKDSHKMNLSALAWVERDNKIKDNTIVFNGLTYGLVLSPDTGRVWLDRNLGASQVCTSVTDTACYGDLYQWGRAKDGHESRDSGITKTLASSITPATTTLIISQRVPGDWVSGSGTGADISGALRAAAWVDGGVNDICPAGFSVPTEEELITLATTAKVKDTATAFSSFLKLPASGARTADGGRFLGVGTGAPLWSRSARGSFGRFFAIYTNEGNTAFQSVSRAYGFSIRCIKD